MAQLVERLVRNEEASGSNPLISTTQRTAIAVLFCVVEISVHRTVELSAVRARSEKQFALFFLPVGERRHFGVSQNPLSTFSQKTRLHGVFFSTFL